MRKRLLRDSSRSCGHEEAFQLNGVWFHDDNNECPGGMEIVLEEVYVIDSYDDDSEYIPPGAWSAWVEVDEVEE